LESEQLLKEASDLLDKPNTSDGDIEAMTRRLAAALSPKDVFLFRWRAICEKRALHKKLLLRRRVFHSAHLTHVKRAPVNVGSSTVKVVSGSGKVKVGLRKGKLVFKKSSQAGENPTKSKKV
jgi:hypothetical protein